MRFLERLFKPKAKPELNLTAVAMALMDQSFKSHKQTIAGLMKLLSPAHKELGLPPDFWGDKIEQFMMKVQFERAVFDWIVIRSALNDEGVDQSIGTEIKEVLLHVFKDKQSIFSDSHYQTLESAFADREEHYDWLFECLNDLSEDSKDAKWELYSSFFLNPLAADDMDIYFARSFFEFNMNAKMAQDILYKHVTTLLPEYRAAISKAANYK